MVPLNIKDLDFSSNEASLEFIPYLYTPLIHVFSINLELTEERIKIKPILNGIPVRGI